MTEPVRAVGGLGLVAVGLLYLFEALDIIDSAGALIVRWWPLLLVAAGVVRVVADGRVTGGAVGLMVAGGLLQAVRLGLPTDVWRVVWPVALIAAGVWLIVARGLGDTRSPISFLAVRRHVVGAGDYDDGWATALLGSLRLDLTEVTLQPGARLSVTAILGRVDIVVPEGWQVRLGGVPLLGVWDDTTSRDGSGPLLDVRVLAIVGGVEVRHRERWARKKSR